MKPSFANVADRDTEHGNIRVLLAEIARLLLSSMFVVAAVDFTFSLLIGRCCDTDDGL